MVLKMPVPSDSARKLLGTSTPASNLQIDFTFPGEIGAVYNAVMGDDRLINTGDFIEIRDGNDVSIMNNIEGCIWYSFELFGSCKWGNFLCRQTFYFFVHHK